MVTTSALQTRVKQRIEKQTFQKRNFDVIVVGAGSMGSSACYHLARQGHSVLGIDQFDVPHEQGSHAGQTRIIRKAYFEHPDYVPLLETAYQNWAEMEEQSGIQLFYKTGLLYFGKANSPLISGVKNSAAKYGIEVNELSPGKLKEAFPQFDIPTDYERLIEPAAGFVTPERAIMIYLEQALKNGAIIKTRESVISYITNSSGFQLKTNQGSYACKKLILTAGAWTDQLLPEFKSRLNVTRQMIAWVKPKKQNAFEPGDFPCWTMAHPEGKGLYYGFPILPVDQFGPPPGMKVAHHYPGNVTEPNKVNRETTQEEESNLIQFLNEFIPQGYKTTQTTKTCLYTNSPDHHFIMDLHPENKNIVIATGFSGHGFKFASAIGKIVADLAITGKTCQPIDFLGLDRFRWATKMLLFCSIFPILLRYYFYNGTTS